MMILHLEYKHINKHVCKYEIHKSHYDIFFKNICLQINRSRLIINANNKFDVIRNLILAWSYKFNEKAYVNRRRIFRRNTCSSY